MPLKINLTIYNFNENDVQLSIKDGTFNNIASEVIAFFENHFDFEDWSYETVKCSVFTLDGFDLNDLDRCTHLTIDQWIALVEELDQMGHDTTFTNVKNRISQMIEHDLEINSEYAIF
jgi:hypothetical protein